MTDVVQFARPGDVDVLEVVSAPTPEPGVGEVLVVMRAIGVNPLDCKQRAGVRPMPGAGPWRLGIDGAGVVAAVGPDASFAVGDRVVVSGASGTYAGEIVVPASCLDRLPSDWSFEVGAGLGVPVGTAYQVLTSLSLAPGETLLVHGGSGAVGQAAIQLAVATGAAVVATASPSRHDRVVALGATPVAYGPGLLERVRSCAARVDVALDCAGTDEAIEVSTALVADRSRIGTIVRGSDAASLGIRAWLGGSPTPLTEGEVALRREAIGRVLAMPSFSVEIDSRHALADVAAAHRRSDSGHPRGKIVLVP
jgi:NADPH:quinone reductase-like Zn-dependent oxidoreductase